MKIKVVCKANTARYNATLPGRISTKEYDRIVNGKSQFELKEVVINNSLNLNDYDSLHIYDDYIYGFIKSKALLLNLKFNENTIVSYKNMILDNKTSLRVLLDLFPNRTLLIDNCGANAWNGVFQIRAAPRCKSDFNWLIYIKNQKLSEIKLINPHVGYRLDDRVK